MSGKYFILEQLQNKEDIFTTSFTSHFCMPGNTSNEEHPSNIPEILVVFDKFHFEILGKYCNEEHL